MTTYPQKTKEKLMEKHLKKYKSVETEGKNHTKNPHESVISEQVNQRTIDRREQTEQLSRHSANKKLW